MPHYFFTGLPTYGYTMVFERRKQTKPQVAKEVAGKEVDPRYQWLRLYVACFTAVISLLPALALLWVFPQRHHDLHAAQRRGQVLQEVAHAQRVLDDQLRSGETTVADADPALAWPQDLGPSCVVFLLDDQGALQTPSPTAEEFLQHRSGGRLSRPSEPTILEEADRRGDSKMLAYVGLEQAPGVLCVLVTTDEVLAKLAFPWGSVCWILAVSVTLVLVSTIWYSSDLLTRIRKADEELVDALHNVQYTNQMASIGRLAAGVAHEINNPLSIIEENAGLLSDLLTLKKETPEPERLLKIAETVRASVARCAAITHGLLGFARNMEPKIMLIDLAGLIEEVLSFERRLARHRNIEIQLDIPEGLPEIESDRGQLQQIFLNILTNAFDAVEDEGRIEIAMTLENDNTVVVQVTDNGHGIPEENLKQIFEPFFTTKLVYGTGLGLSITYGLVTKLGGSIDVQSSAGEGSTFTISLPLKSPGKDE